MANEADLARSLLPRLIRLRDAPYYLGMDKNRFGQEVRPKVTEIPIGHQGVAFDRLELDAWVEEYKRRNGRPGHSEGARLWDVKRRQDSTYGERPGTLTRSSSDSELTNLLEQAILKKRSST